MNYKKYLDTYYQSVALVWKLDPNRREARVLRYIAKGLLHPVASINWLSTLKEVPQLSLWFRSNPRLLLKPSRHYISRNYNFGLRAQIILNHYTILIGLLSRPSYEALSQGTTHLLATIVGKKGGHYQITLRKTDKFDREGELVLGLKDCTQDRHVFWFVFSLTRYEDQAGIEIGCIQGPRSGDARELIKRATKELYGIRPRNLLADALYELATAWGLSKYFGVCNRSRVYNGYQTHADYDAFWMELGGILDRDGMFRLPTKLFHHQLSEVPSHHRSEYGRRIKLRGILSKQIIMAAKTLGFPAEEIRVSALNNRLFQKVN